jgi:hypothetical protein
MVVEAADDVVEVRVIERRVDRERIEIAAGLTNAGVNT